MMRENRGTCHVNVSSGADTHRAALGCPRVLCGRSKEEDQLLHRSKLFLRSSWCKLFEEVLSKCLLEVSPFPHIQCPYLGGPEIKHISLIFIPKSRHLSHDTPLSQRSFPDLFRSVRSPRHPNTKTVEYEGYVLDFSDLARRDIEY